MAMTVDGSLSSFATAAFDVAIIGGGVAGCAAARSLAATNAGGTKQTITIYEIGRGPGGRASTRKSRQIPPMRINHGAPCADISTPAGRDALRDLHLPPFVGRVGGIDSSSGRFTPRPADDSGDPPLYVTGENNEMTQLASSLLAGVRPPSALTTRYSTMVRGLSRNHDDGRWQLHDKSGATVGAADWIIVAGSGVAHPRWTSTFGGAPPLVAAATTLDDPILDQALAAIALQDASPILAVFFYCTGEAAQQWIKLGFSVGEFCDKNPVLSKLIVQPTTHDENTQGCSVVLHSTAAFARTHTGVYGASSSAARVGDAATDTSREESLIQQMLGALADVPGLPPTGAPSMEYGPLLHRWGNAFPRGAPLSERLTLCAASRVGFCGDYTDTPARMGSVEAALLSGLSIGKRVGTLIETKTET